MSLQESGEMYLETIYVLHQDQEIVRSIDLANAMGFSKPSVSRAVHNLEDARYLTIEANGNLKLTDKGLVSAKSLYEKHVFFSNYFIAIGVDEETAIQDACSLEHIISEETFAKVKAHLSTCVDLDGYDYYKAYLNKGRHTEKG